MKTLITILGFDTSQVFAFVVKDGISKGDKVIVLRPKEDSKELRGDRAYGEIKNLLGQISPEIIVEKFVLDTLHFSQMVEEISDVFEKIEGDIIVNISGGLREIIIALTVCSILYNHKILRTYSFSRLEGETKKIELPYLASPLQDNMKNLLDILSQKGSLLYNELTKELNLSKSSISRLAKLLQNKKLVELEDVGKEKKIHLTLTARLLLKIS